MCREHHSPKKRSEALNSRSRTRDVSIAAIFAAMYAAATIALAPISFAIYQLRIADSLIALSLLFGPPSAVGLALGCAIANWYGGLGAVDVIGGSLANFVAAYVGWLLGRSRRRLTRFAATVVQALLIGTIVGGYLALLFGVPIEVGISSITLSSLIAISVLGFALEEVLRSALSGRK